MADGKKRITSKKGATTEQKKRRLTAQFEEWEHPEYDTEFCFKGFIVAQVEKGNSKYTIDFYVNDTVIVNHGDTEIVYH